jgi:hypothetical protein
MTPPPKEKAEELKEKFDGYICYAEIAVDEVLKVAFYANDEIYEYYMKVKNEIEKL